MEPGLGLTLLDTPNSSSSPFYLFIVGVNLRCCPLGTIQHWDLGLNHLD